MILTFELDSNDTNDIKKLISLCENLLSFESKTEESKDINIESIVENKEDIKLDEKENLKISQEELRMKLIELAKNKGKDVVKNMLADIGAEKLSDVKESNYNDLLAKIEEVM